MSEPFKPGDKVAVFDGRGRLSRRAVVELAPRRRGKVAAAGRIYSSDTGYQVGESAWYAGYIEHWTDEHGEAIANANRVNRLGRIDWSMKNPALVAEVIAVLDKHEPPKEG